MAIEVQPSLSPHLCVDGAAAAIDFYAKAFNAVELGRVPGPDGKLVHAALQINGSTVLLNDDFPEYNDGKSSSPIALGGTPVTIHLTVTDVDASFQQAARCRRHRGRPARKTSSGVTATASCATRSGISGHWASPCAKSPWRNSPRR